MSLLPDFMLGFVVGSPSDMSIVLLVAHFLHIEERSVECEQRLGAKANFIPISNAQGQLQVRLAIQRVRFCYLTSVLQHLSSFSQKETSSSAFVLQIKTISGEHA